MKPITIFIFDNVAEELERMQAGVCFLFEPKGVPVEIHTFLLPEIIKNITRNLASYRPEIVFFDNHIGPGADDSMYGQHVISYLKPLFPDVLFALLSKEAVRNDSLDKQYPTPDLFVSKLGLEMAYPDYIDWLYRELTARVTRARVEKIDFDDAKKGFSLLKARSRSGGNRQISNEEIRSLVEQACYTGGSLDDNVIEEVKLRPLPGGLSGAVVTEVSVRNRYGAFNVPAVMKFMERASAERENHNHSKFVKWVLPYRWRVDIIGKGATDEFGCVTYSFAHGGAGNPTTLTSLIREGNLGAVSAIMNSVFSPDSKTWYSNVREHQTPLGVYLARKAPYSVKADEGARREDRFISLLSEYMPANEGKLLSVRGFLILQICDTSVPITSFEAELAGRRLPSSTTECISHGDLNSSNILVRDGSNEFCFIDFQHTGWHHRCKDFCSFEASIRLLIREENARSFSQRVRDEFSAWHRMREQKWIATGPMHLIDETRRLFLANHSGTTEEYALSSAFHTLWLIGLGGWNEFEMRRLISFFIGTLWWLQNN